MGMHITIEVVDAFVKEKNIQEIFRYFTYIDKTFSTYKVDSEITKINKGLIEEADYSEDMKTVLALCDRTQKETNGYFDSVHDGMIDPTGVVKGWSILQAAKLLKKRGFEHFYVDAGGDVQVSGKNTKGEQWTVGIRNPFNSSQIVKVIALKDQGIATSGTAVRGQHIYNPHNPAEKITDIVSLTVVGPNVLEADRFATAAFAMGKEGNAFIGGQPGLEGYMIDKNGIATYTDGFGHFVIKE